MTLDTAGEAGGPARRNRADRRAQILDAAEMRARRGGYNGFSFRDIASDVGLRSASVHHHFPTKTALARALVERYAERMMLEIGPARECGALLRLISAYRSALHERDAMCLCTILAGEIDSLPGEVADAVRAAFAGLVDWTEIALGPEAGRTGAETMVSGLSGALLTARAVGDVDMFDRIAGGLLDAARGQPWRSTAA